MAALSLRPTLTEVLKVLTPCHGATLHSVARCATQGHVSLFPHGWDAPSSHGREDYAKAVGLPFRAETKASLAPLRLTALAHSKLDTLWHNRCAGGAPFPYRHPSFLRQRRVSAWVASLATLG